MAPRPQPAPTTLRDRASRRVESEARIYASDAEDDRPLGGYLALLGIYLTYVLTLGGIVKVKHVELPEQVSPSDLALLAVATHKVARILSKDSVLSPLRANFTTFSGPSGEGEIAEAPRGRGLRHAIGELVTCPFCLGQWVATFLVFALVMAPRLTRLAASVFVLLTGSDLLQLAYAKAQASIT